MKVLQINKYAKESGGTETVLFKTISLLKQKGHEVILFALKEEKPIYEKTYMLDFIDLRKASLKDKFKHALDFFYNKKAADLLAEIIKKEKPDIAHIHLYLNGFSLSILPVLKRHNIPVIMSLHEYRQICPSYLLLDAKLQICERCKSGNYLNCLFTRCSKGNLQESALLTLEMYYRRLFYKTEKYVDTFISVSNFIKQKHQQFNPKLASKIQTLYNPVEIPAPSISYKGNYFLYFGRISREKGVKTLVEAAKLLPHIRFKIAGKGEYLDHIGEMPQNIDYVGFKLGDELKELIINCSFVIVPSEWYETFGLSLVESLSLGKPVIASKIGAFSEIITKENSLIFENKNIENLKDTILQAEQMPQEEYNAMSKNAYHSSIRFSEDIHIEKLLNIYNTAIKSN